MKNSIYPVLTVCLLLCHSSSAKCQNFTSPGQHYQKEVLVQFNEKSDGTISATLRVLAKCDEDVELMPKSGYIIVSNSEIFDMTSEKRHKLQSTNYQKKYILDYEVTEQSSGPIYSFQGTVLSVKPCKSSWWKFWQ